ncbi:MAG: DMT family transporter [Candidatus Uhrbacteria bacterium]
MSWIAIAIGGHLLNAIAFIVDKTLLSSSFKRSGTYAAVIGFFSGLVLFLAPWIAHLPDPITWIAIATFGITFVLAMWGFFEALSRAEASRVVPVVGSLIPLFTLVASMILIHERLTGRTLVGFVILIIATLLLTRSGHKDKHLDHSTFYLCIGSAFVFAISTALGKFAFERAPFLDVFVLSRLFSAATALLIPIFSLEVRKELSSLFKPKKEQNGKGYHAAALMLFGQICGAIGFIGVQYAVALGSATVVNALQAVQYAAIVLLAWIGGKKLAALLHEERTWHVLLFKGLAIIFVGVGLAFVSWLPATVSTKYGFTWSMPYAREIGIDPKAGYETALKELHPKHVRLMAYWSEIEAEEKTYDFSDLDWQLQTSEQNGVSVTLAIGARLPRWPECWAPDWISGLSQYDIDRSQLNYLKAVYTHVKDQKGIVSWQIENEPQLNSFQSCAGMSKDLALQEIRWVREQEQARQTPRPVGTTDSGELSSWLNFPGETDQLGVSVYRIVTNPMFGTVHWLLPADFYSTKAALVQNWTGPIYVSEMQMEPWSDVSLANTPIEKQIAQFDEAQMKNNFDYASRLEMPIVDFWGVEWWLWMKEKQGHPEYWEAAKRFMNP